jgi:hypothetical protein
MGRRRAVQSVAAYTVPAGLVSERGIRHTPRANEVSERSGCLTSRRILTRGPSNEPLWVQLYLYPLGDRWVATIVADGVAPPGPSELKGTAFFGDTPAEAKETALRYWGGWSRTDALSRSDPIWDQGYAARHLTGSSA